MNLQTTLVQIRQSLNENIDEKTLNSEKKYFKEAFKMYGVSVPVTIKIGKQIFGLIKDASKQEIFELCEELWKSGYNEEAFIACNFSYAMHRNYEMADFDIFEHWVNEYVSNWAMCDTLCNHTVGTYIEMFPEKITELKRWAQSPNRWMKRAAAVTLIIPARKGLFQNQIIEIADYLLTDPDDLVQKGYGWMLKACSQANTDLVFNYVCSRKTIMPRTALRYAIEKMPVDLKKIAMAK